MIYRHKCEIHFGEATGRTITFVCGTTLHMFMAGPVKNPHGKLGWLKISSVPPERLEAALLRELSR